LGMDRAEHEGADENLPPLARRILLRDRRAVGRLVPQVVQGSGRRADAAVSTA
jgi:hypothetical protein